MADTASSVDDRPSKTQRKRDAHDLQALGDALAELPADRLAVLELPQSLRDALDELRSIRSHEGRRRQAQYIGKLMRQVDAGKIHEDYLTILEDADTIFPFGDMDFRVFCRS